MAIDLAINAHPSAQATSPSNLSPARGRSSPIDALPPQVQAWLAVYAESTIAEVNELLALHPNAPGPTKLPSTDPRIQALGLNWTRIALGQGKPSHHVELAATSGSLFARLEEGDQSMVYLVGSLQSAIEMAQSISDKLPGALSQFGD
jgi:hypothetical protein